MRGSPAYNEALNKFLGRPIAGTVGVNSTTAILSPGSTIPAVGKAAPRVWGSKKPVERDLKVERAAYTRKMQDGGVPVKVTDITQPYRGRGVEVYMLSWSAASLPSGPLSSRSTAATA